MSIEVSEEIRKNFHLFWDNFPTAVTLVYKDRTIIEANKAAQELGYPVGMKCVDLGEKKHHAGCKAHVALRDKVGVREVGYYDFLGKVIDGYWIPLAGAEEFYVHFGIDITEYAADRLFPEKSSVGCECAGSCSGA
ncbi:MAG: hypothetical protein A2X80_10130 [Geobacteraceae bacterium GWB2_52_12]|nr:MAG: hypothetical protein A2X80_10130 [Geobacteraceae bacterium GWB2_52_12]